MTEAEWLVCCSPEVMLTFIRERLTNRKLRLFAVACCRQTWTHLTKAAQFAVEVAERHAEGNATQKELLEANRAVWTEFCQTPEGEGWGGNRATGYFASYRQNWFAAVRTSHSAASLITGRNLEVVVASVDPPPSAWDRPTRKAVFEAERAGHLRQQCHILRCLICPFRATVFERAWRTESVVALASGIYTQRRFDHLPILADAFEEAGCDNLKLLNHLRGDTPHVLGCWALDLALGKS